MFEKPLVYEECIEVINDLKQEVRAYKAQADNWHILADRLLEKHPEDGTLEFLCETWGIELEGA